MLTSKSVQLEMFFLPFLAPGHMIPLTDIAKLLAARGEKVTIITTPMNALLLQNSIETETKSGHQIGLHILKFSAAEAGLPEGCENLASTTSLDMAAKLYHAAANLRPQIEQLLHERRPDCIVSDMFYPWTTDIAADLGIPRVVFNPRCFLALCTTDSIHRFLPHEKVQSDDETFIVPGLPDPIVMTRSQLPNYRAERYAEWMEILREAEVRSHGVLVNSFYELEPAYVEHFTTTMKRKAWAVGPVSLCNNRKSTANKADRIHKSVIDEHSCLTWLDSKKPNSVLYVSFGSGCKFPDSQLFEIASALEASGCQFIWVVLGKEVHEKKDEQDQTWLPNGFEERMKKEGDRGMIVRGWAPQLLILDHSAIGGFLTHCGWNSVLEAVTAGVPMITWPLAADHFYDEKLVTQVLKIGVEVGFRDWNMSVDVERELVSREKIEKAVSVLMVDEDEATVEMRKRAKELSVKAKMAVEKNGSSYVNLTDLINELKSLKAGLV